MQNIILYLNNQKIDDREGLVSAVDMLVPDSVCYYDLINYARTGDLKRWFNENHLTAEAKCIEDINESTTDNDVVNIILKTLGVNHNVPKVPFQDVFNIEHVGISLLEDNTLQVKIIFNVVKHVNESYCLIVASSEQEQQVLLSPKDYVVKKSYIRSVTVPYNADKKIVLKCDNRILKTLDYIDEGCNLEKCSSQGKYGFKDKRTGKIVIPCQFDFVQDFHDNIAIVGRNGKYGAIDTSGNSVIPCKYDSIDTFYNGRAIVKNGKLYGFLAKESYQEVIPCQYEKVHPFTEWNATIVDNVVIDRSGKILYEGRDLQCFEKGFAVDKGRALVNTEGEVVYQGNVLSFSEGIIRLYEDAVNAQYFCKITGERITDTYFEDGSSDFHEGIALVRKNGLYGYIDKKGHYILTPQFDEARDFHNGYAAVCKRFDTEDDYAYYWGFINPKGEYLFDIQKCKYTKVEDFNEQGIATVEVNGTFSSITKEVQYESEHGGNFISINKLKSLLMNKCLWIVTIIVTAITIFISESPLCEDVDTLNDKAYQYWKEDQTSSKCAMLYYIAALKGSRSAVHNLAYYYECNYEYEKAIEWYKKAAAHGDEDACLQIGNLYYYGNGVEQNYAEAVKWYTQVNDFTVNARGEAATNLAHCYYNGWGTPQKYSKAVKLYREVAFWSSDAAYCLGNCYYEGHGVPQDTHEAIEWYKKAANHLYEENEDAKLKLSELGVTQY